jgi:hypothetical protein
MGRTDQVDVVTGGWVGLARISYSIAGHAVYCPYIQYIFYFIIMHLGAFCIENAPTLSAATVIVLVAIGSRPVANRSL